MGERFTLDVDSFQRLLAAAWVLQCERDRKSSENNSVADSAVFLGSKVNRIPANFPIPSYIFEAETRRNQSQVLSEGTGSGVEVVASQVVPTPLQAQSPPMDEVEVLRPKVAAFVPVQSEVNGSLALVPERHEAAESNAIPFLLEELQEESAWKKIERNVRSVARRALSVAEWRQGSRSELRVKVIIRRRTRDHLARYVAPVITLLVVGMMLIPQISSRVGWLRSVRAAAHLSGNMIGMGEAGPVMEASHLRVTDAAESALLDQMSRYEVRSVQRQAEFGDDAAALTLAMAYEIGRGVPQNCKAASRWVEVAAEDGNAAAEYNLGLRYLSGDGVREDHAEGKKWLEAASRQGYEKARVILHSMNS